MLGAWRGPRPVYYRDKRGAELVDEFIESLPAKRAAKIDDFVEEHLNAKPPDAPPPQYPISSQIEGELRELRVRFANTRYRILCQRGGNLIVLAACDREGHRGRSRCRHRARQAAHSRLQAPHERGAPGATAGGG